MGQDLSVQFVIDEIDNSSIMSDINVFSPDAVTLLKKSIEHNDEKLFKTILNDMNNIAKPWDKYSVKFEDGTTFWEFFINNANTSLCENLYSRIITFFENYIYDVKILGRMECRLKISKFLQLMLGDKSSKRKIDMFCSNNIIDDVIIVKWLKKIFLKMSGLMHFAKFTNGIFEFETNIRNEKFQKYINFIIQIFNTKPELMRYLFGEHSILGLKYCIKHGNYVLIKQLNKFNVRYNSFYVDYLYDMGEIDGYCLELYLMLVKDKPLRNYITFNTAKNILTHYKRNPGLISLNIIETIANIPEIKKSKEIKSTIESLLLDRHGMDMIRMLDLSHQQIIDLFNKYWKYVELYHPPNQHLFESIDKMLIESKDNFEHIKETLLVTLNKTIKYLLFNYSKKFESSMLIMELFKNNHKIHFKIERDEFNYRLLINKMDVNGFFSKNLIVLKSTLEKEISLLESENLHIKYYDLKNVDFAVFKEIHELNPVIMIGKHSDNSIYILARQKPGNICMRLDENDEIVKNNFKDLYSGNMREYIIISNVDNLIKIDNFLNLKDEFNTHSLYDDRIKKPINETMIEAMSSAKPYNIQMINQFFEYYPNIRDIFEFYPRSFNTSYKKTKLFKMFISNGRVDVLCAQSDIIGYDLLLLIDDQKFTKNQKKE